MKALLQSELYWSAAVSALYTVLCPRLNHYFYRLLLFHPQRFADETTTLPAVAGIDGTELWFSGSMGQRLNGWLYNKPGAKHMILFNHGNAGNILGRVVLAELLLNAGAAVCIYDYQGFGKSTGKPTVEGVCDDALAAYNHLVKYHGIEPGKIVLYGESLGVSVATYLSSVRTCAGLILQSGFTSLRRIALDTYPPMFVYPQWLFPSPPLDNIAILRKPHPPLLLIHGQQDAVVPFAHARDLFGQAAEPKTLLPLPQTGHNDIAYTAAVDYTKAVAAFLTALPQAVPDPARTV